MLRLWRLVWYTSRQPGVSGRKQEQGCMMRHLAMRMISAAALSLGLTAAASAADLRPAYKAPAPVAAPYNYSWSGFYIGGHAGGGWTDGESGFVGGGQIGYNWQLSPNWVIGV